MIKNFKSIILNLLLFSVFSTMGVSGTTPARQENHPPVVKIISPNNNSPVEGGTQVNYEISVADKEDGDTRFDEINAKEVLLEVKYLADKNKPAAFINKPVKNDPPGLAVLRSSNCFNCHNFSGKATGPSFNEIAAKYTPTPANIELLIKHVREGSSGIWGKETMPTHPELSLQQTKSTVQWILKNAKDPDVSYYIGTTGTFHTKPAAGKKGAYVLAASYADHGLKNSSAPHLKGQDIIVLTVR